MWQGIIRQKRGTGEKELSYEAWNSQEIGDISVPFVRYMAFDKQSIATPLPRYHHHEQDRVSE